MFLNRATLADRSEFSLTDHLTNCYERYSTIEPDVKAFIPEDDLNNRLKRDLSSLLDARISLDGVILLSPHSIPSDF
ncbi:hypothetical protein [Paenibacillus sp. An7]|uniref:hypothetical protein n=1 Tax=Paenibacillus sp. An7 TaxID=2689577 RepID=UPI00135C07E7|nr:hypothetical protein [Paenibacillus sp. An7]